MRNLFDAVTSRRNPIMKKIIIVAVCLSLSGCYTPPVKKEGMALGFKRTNSNDADFKQANFGEKTPATTTSSSTIGVGASSGAGVAVINAPIPTAKAIAAGAISTPVIIVGSVAIAAGAATALLLSALTPDTDCGDGWALFTLKTAEGEVKTIRQARAAVCEFKNGDSVQYLENETGIIVLRR
jgi:hypothetical protein